MNRWTVHDRFGNVIYFTEERWRHILESRPELEPFLDQFLETLRSSQRNQDSLFPNEYQYFKRFDELLPKNNHLVVVVVFKRQLDERGNFVSNNFVVTGWANYFRPKK